MIEMALFLPMLLIFVFAVMDFGNYMIIKNRMVSATQAVASAIQNNPTMSAEDLRQVQASTLGNLTRGGYTGYAIWTSKTPPTPETSPRRGATRFVNGILTAGAPEFFTQDITNPWLDDGDPANDNNPYYVAVYLYKGVPYLTPLPRMISGLRSQVSFGDSEVSQATGAPYGRKTAQAFTFVTLNNASCEANHVLVSKEGGQWTCAKPVLTYTKSAANCRWTEEDADCLATEISVYSYSRSKGSLYENPRGDGKCNSDEDNYVRLLAGLDGSCRGISSNSMNYCCEVSKSFTITFQ
jgi:hypothetical protein